MLYSVEIYFLIFMTYSVLGWAMEVILKFNECKRFINRGFLIGPYCPIYGYGGLLITFLLGKYTNDPLVLFLLGMMLCALLEYLTSFIMEKVFHARWWDYSTRKFNINGRICLETMIPFGLLGLLIMYVLNPFFLKIFETMDNLTLNIVSGVIFSIYIIDNIVSTVILSNINRDYKALSGDNTEEMSTNVKETILGHGWARKRLLKAFPNVRYIRVMIKKNVQKVKNKTEQKQEEIKRKTEEEIMKLKSEYEFRIKTIKNKANEKIKKINKKNLRR